MNDIDNLLRETLDAQAGTVTPSPGLATRATRRSTQIRHRRVAAAGATTAVVVGVGVTSVAATHVIGQERNSSSKPSETVKVAAPTDSLSSSAVPRNPAADPSPTPNFGSICPDGQAPEVTATGSATDNGDVRSDGGAETVTQSVMQSYLIDISNHEPLSGYGVGTDSASGHAVAWIKFENQSIVELVINDNKGQWSSYDATLGPCQQIGN